VKSSFIETIKSIDGKVCHIEYHQKRYTEVLNSFGINEIKDLNEFLKPPKYGLYRCRLVYSTTNLKNIEVTYHKYEKRKVETLKIVYDDNIEYSQKQSDRSEFDRLYALRDICDDILIVKNKLITDTSIANIAFYDNGVWLTPKSPLLRGTTRDRLLETGKIVEADIGVDDLKRFSKVALLNAMIDFDIITDISFIN